MVDRKYNRSMHYTSLVAIISVALRGPLAAEDVTAKSSGQERVAEDAENTWEVPKMFTFARGSLPPRTVQTTTPAPC